MTWRDGTCCSTTRAPEARPWWWREEDREGQTREAPDPSSDSLTRQVTLKPYLVGGQNSGTPGLLLATPGIA